MQNTFNSIVNFFLVDRRCNRVNSLAYLRELSMFTKLLPFIHSYLNSLQEALAKDSQSSRLSGIQRFWIGFCLMGILITNSIAWEKFERRSFRRYTKQALSRMCRWSKIPWDRLLICSVRAVLGKYGITKGVLIVDDKDLSRSKNARKLHALHKVFDKKTSGYFLGQNVVFLYLVTEAICIPVAFAFYQPDPIWSAWCKHDRQLKKAGVSKKDRPKKPQRSNAYPKKFELALCLLTKFSKDFPNFSVTAVLADTLYGNGLFIDGVNAIWPKVQVITQIRANQKIMSRNKEFSCEEYFHSYKGWMQEVLIRGQRKVSVEAGSARVHVSSQGKKRFVIALKYLGEPTYRFLIGSNLAWNMKEIMQAYTLRWLIEVFFEDWSCYSGFCSMAKQRGVEGSERPLILSLLFDHCFFFHTQQIHFVANKLPLATLGSLVERSRFDALCDLLNHVLESQDPKKSIEELTSSIHEIFKIRASRKHMNGLYPTFESSKLAA